MGIPLSSLDPALQARIAAEDRNKRPSAPPAPKRSKYGAKHTAYGGVVYDSKAEAARAEELDYMKRAGLIRGWERQVTFHLGCPENSYRVDFMVFGGDGVAWAEDVKGMRTSKFAHDLKLWKQYGPCPLRIIGKTTEVVQGGYEISEKEGSNG